VTTSSRPLDVLYRTDFAKDQDLAEVVGLEPTNKAALTKD
jgi:hypothetical protein